MTAIENKQDLVIEGAYIFPEYLSDFSMEYLEHILPVFICFTEKYIRSNYETDILKYRHVAEAREYEEEMEQVYRFIKRRIHGYQNRMCKLP